MSKNYSTGKAREEQQFVKQKKLSKQLVAAVLICNGFSKDATTVLRVSISGSKCCPNSRSPTIVFLLISRGVHHRHFVFFIHTQHHVVVAILFIGSIIKDVDELKTSIGTLSAEIRSNKESRTASADHEKILEIHERELTDRRNNVIIVGLAEVENKSSGDRCRS